MTLAAAHFDAAMHRLLTDLREFDERGGWHVQGAMSCAHWLSWRVGWDLVTARDRVRVARKLPEFPALDDALRRGEISYSKVRAMVRVATPANEHLCGLHHRHVHEYGYTIEFDTDGKPQFRDPHGRLVAAVPPPVAWTDLGWPRMRAANEALGIDASTIACGWDGSPVDYGMVIDDLVVADGLQ
jgi:hypothetical protein